MRKTLLTSAAVLGLAMGVPAFAQTTMNGTGGMGATNGVPAGGPAGMVRPGHIPGVGNSEPASTQASNIDRADTRSVIAPRLPTPQVGANATPEQLLGVAQRALNRHRTGEAQEALERAETRALDRSTAPQSASTPNSAPMIQAIADARRSLASHDIAGTQQAISRAMSSSAYAQNGAQNGGPGMGGSNAGMSGGMSGAGMSGAPALGQAPAAGGATVMPGSTPGSNALSTTGATNGNSISADTGGPSNASGIPGTPNGISGNLGSNASNAGGTSSGGAAGTSK